MSTFFELPAEAWTPDVIESTTSLTAVLTFSAVLKDLEQRANAKIKDHGAQQATQFLTSSWKTIGNFGKDKEDNDFSYYPQDSDAFTEILNSCMNGLSGWLAWGMLYEGAEHSQLCIEKARDVSIENATEILVHVDKVQKEDLFIAEIKLPDYRGQNDLYDDKVKLANMMIDDDIEDKDICGFLVQVHQTTSSFISGNTFQATYLPAGRQKLCCLLSIMIFNLGIGTLSRSFNTVENVSAAVKIVDSIASDIQASAGDSKKVDSF
ncbi:6915_t:CDS:2 [Ambispora gerdemannii]|uniref:6915_t:CDS:1 n=1 Tax=Ambispora gerdemannii TaxID=144530 RepID=A0A9N8ZNM2_9GLOM|nr:6915_t:CDS:2 [Ambispora gerdemannii]